MVLVLLLKWEPNTSRFASTYQVEVPLEAGKLLGAKVLGKNSVGKFRCIEDAKSSARIRPFDYFRVIGGAINQLRLAIKHLVEPTRELLRNSSLSSARKG